MGICKPTNRIPKRHLRRRELPARKIDLTRPQSLTRRDLKALRLALDEAGYPVSSLRAAWKDAKNGEIAADLIGFIRTLSMGDPLVPVEVRVKNAMAEVRRLRRWTKPQQKWLDRIEAHLLRFSLIDREDFEEPPFRQKGGYDRINQQLGEELDTVLTTLRTHMFPSQTG